MHPFQREQMEFQRNAPVRGEATGTAVRSQHTVAWHHKRERVAPERLPHGARRPGRAALRRQFTVRDHRPRWDCPCDVVHAAVKRRQGVHV